MNDVTALLISFVAGICLGLFFFVGLWWTLQKAISSPKVALWLSASMILRTTVVLLGFYYIGHASWQRMIACLVGFFISRITVVHKTRHLKQIL